MPRIKKGTVVSNKSAKTITVKVDSYRTHPKYQKRYLVSKKFRAHDEENKAQVGDTVIITESIPLSATKRWKLVEIITPHS